MYRIFILMASMSLSNTILAAEIYRCTIDEQVEYSRVPCEDGQGERLQKLEQIQSQGKTQSLDVRDASNQNKTDQGDSQASVKIHILNNKIKRSRSKIKNYQLKMRNELKKIKDKTYYAANNNAGANYLNALSNEMSAVSDKYKVYIDLEKDTIQGYRDDISFIRSR